MSGFREKAVAQLKNYLLRTSLPRLQMSCIVLVTGVAGFLVSFALLQAGMQTMWIRYTIAILFAYGIFLLLIRVWAETQRAHFRNLPDLDPEDAKNRGEGGYPSCDTDWTDFMRWTDIPGDDPDLGCLPLIPIAIIASVIVAIGAVIFAAPELLAEVFLDAVLISALYKRIQHLERRHWLAAVFKRTWLPVLVVLIIFAGAGALIQSYVPEVHSVGDAWRLWRSR
jgi:uncharacterized membrane protein YedE/YeeE